MKNEVTKKEVPTGIKVISILGIIISVGLIILGIVFLVMTFIEREDSQAFLGLVLGPTMIVLGVPVLLLSIFLLKLKNWARITIIALSLSEALLTLIGFTSSIFPFYWGFFLTQVVRIAFGLAISLYLLLNENVKKAFSK